MKRKDRQPIRWSALLALAALLGLLALSGCSSSADSAFSLTGVEWQWTSLNNQGTPDGGTTEVPNPQNYTVNFNPDGTLNGRADCNNYAGTYTQANNGIQIMLGPTTLAACPEGSLDTLFLGTLGQIVAGGPDGSGNLALETAGGAQRMVFRNPAAADSGSDGLPWWLWLLLIALGIGVLGQLFRPKREPAAPDTETRPSPPPVARPAAPEAAAEPVVDPDDLTRIEGIGPKIAGALNEAGINTFAALAATSSEELQRILDASSLRVTAADPTTWPEQAELAAAGRWDDLQALQDKLDGGRLA